VYVDRPLTHAAQGAEKSERLLIQAKTSARYIGNSTLSSRRPWFSLKQKLPLCTVVGKLP